jgi:hypothetical protein
MGADLDKVNKLICRIQNFVLCLKRSNDTDIHRNIDEFYYMQKLEELEILKSQMNETNDRLQSINNRIHLHYQEIASKWSKDIRWMSFQTRNANKTKMQ